jgi:hypothetical protein
MARPLAIIKREELRSMLAIMVSPTIPRNYPRTTNVDSLWIKIDQPLTFIMSMTVSRAVGLFV